MLNLVQIYRAFAVGLVVLFHASLVTNNRYGVLPVDRLFDVGFAGVHVFFVLSGFIILTAHYGDVGNPGQIFRYLSRRIIRIYPLYWIVFIVFGGWRVLSGALPLYDFVTNAFEFSSKVKQVITVSWTLRHEVVFYLVFSVLILSARAGFFVVFLWMALVVYFDDASGTILNPINLEFAIGMTSALICRRIVSMDSFRRNFFGISCFVLGIASFALFVVSAHNNPAVFDKWPTHAVSVYGVGISTAFLLLGTVSPILEGFAGRQKTALLIGNASYSIYLVHIQFEKIAADFLKSVRWFWDYNKPNMLCADIIFWVSSFFGLAVGVMVYKLIEKPFVFGYLRRIVDRMVMDSNPSRITHL